MLIGAAERDVMHDQERTARAAGAPTVGCPEILVIGLGNPILGDDGVGWRVAQRVGTQLLPSESIEVDCLAVGGLRLMERVLGYRRVIVIDAIESGTSPAGSVSVLSLNELEDRGWGHSASAHDASLKTALRTATAMGSSIPSQIEIVAIEAGSCREFSEELSPPVDAAVSVAAEKVIELLQR